MEDRAALSSFVVPINDCIAVSPPGALSRPIRTNRASLGSRQILGMVEVDCERLFSMRAKIDASLA